MSSSLSKNARVGGMVGIVRLIYIANIQLASDNAATTANKIAAHESLFRFGIFSELLTSPVDLRYAGPLSVA
jgi:hypothetical protein